MNSTIRVSLTAAVVASLAISAFAALAEKYADFGKGPAQFLMTRDEAAKWKTIKDDAEAQSFIDLFWARRDPTPGTPQNEFHDAFDARVKAADEQFTHGKMRGALTDRGKVLIVMGGPSSIAKQAGPPTTNSIATPTSGTNPGVNPEAVQGYSPKQVWYYDKGKTNLPLEQPKVEVAFIDQYSGNDWKIERTGRVDYTTLFDRVAQSYITQPNLTSAPAPQPAAAPVPVAAPAAPDASLHTEAYKAAVAEAKGGKSALARNTRLASAEFVSPAGDYYVPVQIYVDKAAGLTAESADTIFGVVTDASGAVVASFEEPAKPMLSKGDLLADKSLSLPTGKYTAVIGIGKGGQPLAIVSGPLELTSVTKDATGISGLILTNDVQEMAEAAPVKTPFAFGKLKIVPKTSIGNKDDLNYFVELHNPGIDATTNLPKLQVKLELSGGKLAQAITAPLTDAPALPLSGAPGPGQYALISAIPLGQLKTPLAPGDYKLKVKVVDTVSKQTFNVEQTFKAPGPPPAAHPTAGSASGRPSKAARAALRRSARKAPRIEALMPLATVPEAAELYRRGELVIIVDDEDRENEGDLCIAAEKVTPEAINFMAKFGRGLICLALTEERCRELDLPLMVEHNTSSYGTAFTVSIEARARVTTGISAFDRAETVRVAIDPKSKPTDLSRPGHVFPLRARKGGVLKRAGQTEASVDLAAIAGMTPAAVICEIMNEDGTMARMPDLRDFAIKHGLKIISVADLINYRMQQEKHVHCLASPILPTDHGEFRVYAYQSDITGEEHVALVKGEIQEDDEVLVRVHSSCLTGDVFHSNRCDCGEQLETAFALIAKEGKGVILYLLQEGRGIGLINKLRAYELQDQGADTIEANAQLGFAPDIRDYGTGSQILRDLGVRKIRLMTNNPAKFVAIEGFGLEIVERVPLEIAPSLTTRKYLEAKKKKLGHILELV